MDVAQAAPGHAAASICPSVLTRAVALAWRSQHYIFNVAFSRAFGTATSASVALQKAAADSFIATPLLGIPIYYACKPTIEGAVGEGPMDGLREYGAGFADFYWKPAMVWIPAHLLTFSVVPTHMRIAWTATVSVGWLSFVSMTSHSSSSSSSSSSS
eukprot:COSAG06_NODE_3882_length_4808_cov_2.751327_2_plen_157_part_00